MGVGDSLMTQILPAVAHDVPGWAYSGEGRPGTGLVDDGKYDFDWLARLRELVAERDPDVVVAWFMGVYWDKAGNQIPAWRLHDRWAAATDEAMRILTARGATVLWVLTPHMRDPGWDDTAMMVNALYRGLPSRWREIRLVDAKTPLDGPGDTYAQVLPNAQGEPEQVRTLDGTHLTAEGMARIMPNFAAALGGYDRAAFRLR
jgi:hypothetical protein